MTTADVPVVRLSSPGDIASAVPHLCGFVPAESLVVISLRGERRRIGLTLRLDLMPAALDFQVADEVASRLAHDEAGSAVIVVYTDAAGQRPRHTLVRAVIDAIEEHGITVMEGMLVRDGLWSSYTCEQSCCPAGGTPLPTAQPLLAAAAAFDGRAVLPSREQLVASLASAPRTPQLERLFDQAATDSLASLEHLGRDKTRIAAIHAWRCALTEPHDTAALIVALQDVLVRDEIATWALDDSEALLTLLTSLLRQTIAPYDVPLLTLIGLVAWVRGDGAAANVAFDRALDGDPDYSMAKLLRVGLDGQMPPSVVKAWLADTRKVLHP